MQWIGASPNKGQLVAAFGDWTLRIDDAFDPGHQWVMPLHVDGPVRIRMLAVWDMNHRRSGLDSSRRLGSCRASMNHNAEFLSSPADLTVITGDLNNSVYWDKPGGTARFGVLRTSCRLADLSARTTTGTAASAAPNHIPPSRGTRNVDKPYRVD